MKLQTLKLAGAVDRKKEILDHVGDLSGFTWLGNMVVVGTLLEPKMSAGGIHFTDRRIDEGRFQSKIGLVLAMGPDAFVLDDNLPYEGPKPKIGDWVMFRPSDSWEIALGKDRGEGAPCRMMDYRVIRAIVDTPDMVW